MANTIRIKRRVSGASGAPSTLANAEICFNEVDNTLYYGKGVGTGGASTAIVAIAGDGTFATKSYVDGAITAYNPNLSSYARLDGASFTGSVTVGGNLVVSGTTTTVNSTTLAVADKNIELAKVDSPNDTTADGGGITVKGSTDKSLTWSYSASAWTSSESFNLASGKSYAINGTAVLSSSALGTGVTGSSLTSVGTLTSGTWNASTVQPAYGGTGLTSVINGLVKGNGSAYSAATDGTDYLSPNSAVDGGTF